MDARLEASPRSLAPCFLFPRSTAALPRCIHRPAVCCASVPPLRGLKTARCARGSIHRQARAVLSPRIPAGAVRSSAHPRPRRARPQRSAPCIALAWPEPDPHTARCSPERAEVRWPQAAWQASPERLAGPAGARVAQALAAKKMAPKPHCSAASALGSFPCLKKARCPHRSAAAPSADFALQLKAWESSHSPATAADPQQAPALEVPRWPQPHSRRDVQPRNRARSTNRTAARGRKKSPAAQADSASLPYRRCLPLPVPQAPVPVRLRQNIRSCAAFIHTQFTPPAAPHGCSPAGFNAAPTLFNSDIISSGSGKTTVVFFSTPMSARVCK